MAGPLDGEPVFNCQDWPAILSMNLKIPVQYSFLGLQGMTSKVHIVPKNREHQKVLHLSGFGPCSNEKAAKKCLAGTISQKKLLSELVGNATFSLFWQGFCPSFSILRIAGQIKPMLTNNDFRVKYPARRSGGIGRRATFRA